MKKVLKMSPINPSSAVGIRYRNQLYKLINRMTAKTERELEKLFTSRDAKQYFAQDDSVASQARILMNALMEQFTALFDDYAKMTAQQFASGANRANKVAVKSSLRDLSENLSLGRLNLDKGTSEILKAVVAENVGLIKSIPQKYLQGVQGAVMRSITTGNGMQDLYPYIKKHKGITKRRADFISLDQTRKANNALAKQRLQNAGIKKFKWHHTGGGKTYRPLHKEMDGKIYDIKNPPLIQRAHKSQPTVYGYPGQLPGCRCRMTGVVDFTAD